MYSALAGACNYSIRRNKQEGNAEYLFASGGNARTRHETAARDEVGKVVKINDGFVFKPLKELEESEEKLWMKLSKKF